MDKNDAQSRLMDYLYDEMDPKEHKSFEKILRDNPDLQQELDEMRATRNLLQEDTDEITPKNLLLIQPDTCESTPETKNSNPRESAKIFVLKTFTAVAAAILIAISLFSFTNLQIMQTGQGTLISFGTVPQSIEEPAQAEEFITQDEFYVMMSELQEQNNRVMATALEQTRQQHRQQMENVIKTLTTYYDQRRQQDLVLVSEGLAQLEEETYYRFLETEEALEDLIFALNIQQTEE
jgi:hypothetical protein